MWIEKPDFTLKMVVALRDLKDAGRRWTKKSLDSGRALSGVISANLALNSGSTFLPWPNSELLEIPDDLAVSISGARVAPISGAIESLFWMVRPLLEQGSILLVEDDLRRPSDPHLQTTEHSTTVIGGDIVFHLDNADGLASPDQLHSFIGASGSGYPLNAFVLLDISEEKTISCLEQEDYEMLVSSTDAIVNTILDCDAFCVWLSKKQCTTLREREIVESVSP